MRGNDTKRTRETLTPAETMPITGLRRIATYKKLQSGEMPSIRNGNRYLIPRTALMQWLASCGRQN